MAKKTATSSDRDGLPTTDHMDRLVAAFETMAGEMKVIRQILGLILDDFRWALNNDKFGPECFPRTADLVSRLAEALDAEEDDGSVDEFEADNPPPTSATASAGDRLAPGCQRELWQ